MTTTVFAKPLPTVGGVIYVPPVHNVRKEDYRTGGRATVREILEGENGNGPTNFIVVEEFPEDKYAYDWYYISRAQDGLGKEYGDTPARFE